MCRKSIDVLWCAMWSDDTLNRASEQIVGFARFIEWCGGWPWFHDAEVVRLELDRRGQSKLVFHVLGGPRPAFGPRADPKFSIPREDVTVTFILDGVEDLELSGFNHQNVISDLLLEQNDDRFRITLEPCFGLTGTIDVRTIQVEFQPSDSHHHS